MLDPHCFVYYPAIVKQFELIGLFKKRELLYYKQGKIKADGQYA